MADTTTTTTRETKAAKPKAKASAAQKEQARKARTGAKIAKEKQTKKTTAKKTVTTPTAAPTASTANASALTGIGGVTFAASDYMTGDIWVPDERIPAIDEATYEEYKTKAEGQSRSIEVASLNLKNIAGLHKLEGQSVDIAIAAKTNETRYAKLEGSEIDYQTQLQVNGAKSQKLTQAIAAHEYSTRETGYLNSQISLRDEHFELEINQARNALDEKTARFRAQLAGN